jgi:hypothetical protein
VMSGVWPVEIAHFRKGFSVDALSDFSGTIT